MISSSKNNLTFNILLLVLMCFDLFRMYFFCANRALFPSYLHEFVFRNKFRNEDMFLTMMKTIADNYPL